MIDLTPRQAEVLKTIRQLTRANGRTPNFRELQKAMGFASVNAAYCHVAVLETKGYLRRFTRQPNRSIELVEPN